MGRPGALKIGHESSFAELKASLQKRFGGKAMGLGDDDSEPRPVAKPFAWLKGVASWQGFGVLDAPGSAVSVTLHDGRTYAGELVRVWGAHAQLALWGRVDPPMCIPVADIGAACVIGKHPYAEEQLVRSRQRRGEPALVGRPLASRTPSGKLKKASTADA